MFDTDLSATPGGDGLDGYVPFEGYGLGSESAIESPPLPPDASLDAGAAPAEEQIPDPAAQANPQDAQPSTQTSEQLQAGQGAQGAEPQKEAANQQPGQPDSDPELSAEDNALVNSQPEADRPALKSKLKAASFEGHFTSDKPKAEVADYLETRFPEHYRDFEQTIVARALARTDFNAELFKRDPEGYGAHAMDVYNGAREFFQSQVLKDLTGREDLTPEQAKAALTGEGGLPGAQSLTDEEMAEVRDLWPEIAAKLEAAKAAPPAPDKQEGEQNEQPNFKPEELIERYETQKKAVDDNFEHGISPVVSFVERKVDELIGKAPTEQEFKDNPLAATARAIKRQLFLSGDGGALSSFRNDFGKWGNKRDLEGRNFDQSLKRLGDFAKDGDRDKAASAANELLPFAEVYIEDRLRHPIFKHVDDIIGLVLAGSNPKTPNENFTQGSFNAGSQPQQKKSPEQAFHDLAFEEVD